jgi:hypothetical protein
VPFALKLRAPLLAALAGLLLVAGCGGSDNDPGAVSLVKSAFSRTIGSADVAVDVGANLQGGSVSGPVSLKLSGPYKSNGSTKLPAFDWNIAASGGGANFDGRLTSTGDDVFLNFQGQTYDIGRDNVARYNQALTQTGAPKRKSLKDFGIDPAAWVKGAKREGSASVAGVQTTHVSASIDFDKLLQDLNALAKKAGSTTAAARSVPQLTASDRKQFTDAVKSSSFDVYVGKSDGKVHRLALSVQFDIPKKNQSRTNGVKGGTLNFSVQFSNVGRSVQVTAPSGARPLSDLVGKLGGAAALGGAAGGAGGSGGTPSPSSKQFQAYSKCLDSAPAGDATALQKCAALLK